VIEGLEVSVAEMEPVVPEDDDTPGDGRKILALDIRLRC
jgi:hypothetical protein